MGLKHSASVVKDGLVLYYDMYNRRHSWLGEPTTNQLPTDINLSVYNNFPGDMQVSLIKTNEIYQGSPIWRQTITPVTPAGISYLTAQNNPGIGVFHAAGGGAANQYVGFSICYRSRVVLSAVPLMTSYSNIVGYNVGNVGGNRNLPYRDGWLRGMVVWFDTVARADAKFWAINPRSAVLHTPIEVDWTLPLREIRGNGDSVSAPVFTTRPTNQALLDLMGNHSINVNSLTYTVQGDFSFNGSSDSLSVTEFNLGKGLNPWTMSAWVKADRFLADLGLEPIFSHSSGGPVYSVMSVTQGRIAYWVYQGQWNLYRGDQYIIDGNHHHLTWVNHADGSMSMYVDGQLDATFPNVTLSPGDNNPINMIGGSWAGRFMGRIPVAMRYTRALSADEVMQNYRVHKDRVV